MGKTKIQWTRGDDGSLGETWNPTRGCTKISPGCKNCYASTFAERFRGVPGHPYEQGFDLRLVPDKLDAPLHWKKPRRVFVNSMSDLFHEDVPDEFIAAVFGVMAACPQHTFQILTKRAERLPQWFEWLKKGTPGHMHGPIGAVHEAMSYGGFDKLSFRAWDRMVAIRKSEHGEAASIGDATAWPWQLPNVWLGVSVENQECADERIPHLLRTPAAVRFLSCEPLLEAVDLTPYLVDDLHRMGRAPRMEVDWVIVGGESGHGARPFDLAWARSILAQCKAAQVPVFLKQVGARPVFEKMVRVERRGTVDAERQLVSLHIRDRHGGDPERWPSDLRVREFPQERR